MSLITSLKQYLQESRIELKKVIWPSKKETTHSTMLVIGISLAMAVFLGLLDYIFSFGLERLIQ